MDEAGPEAGIVRRAEDFRDGEFETVKFERRRADYYSSLTEILTMGYAPVDLLHHFPAFVGHMTLWRFLTLYELYKKTLGIAGHIADVGIYKGASSLFFAKLVEIFEPESLTLVHGFDWFRGTDTRDSDPSLIAGTYVEDEQRVRRLVDVQQLNHVLKVHRLDVATELGGFLEGHPSMRFKLVFVDAGTYPVVAESIRGFWPRLVPGGLLVFDQFNNEVAPGEARAVSELLSDYRIETIPNSWMPTAFVQKPHRT